MAVIWFRPQCADMMRVIREHKLSFTCTFKAASFEIGITLAFPFDTGGMFVASRITHNGALDAFSLLVTSLLHSPFRPKLKKESKAEKLGQPAN